jgi:N-acetylneuraminic acid mutarotase
MVTANGNYIYAISGETASEITNSVERFDPENNEWLSVTEKPTPVKDASAVVIGGKIYIPGGELDDGSISNKLEIFDPVDEQWETGKEVPAPISGYALASFEGKLYLFGGWDGKEILSSVYEYNPDDNIWTQRSSMPTARKYAGAAVSGGSIYVIGGYDGNSALAINEIYQPNLDENQDQVWEVGPSLPEARYGMGVTSLADIIHVIGGAGNGEMGLVSLVFSPETGTWQSVKTGEPVGSKIGLASLGEYIYVVGGIIDNSPVDTNIAYRALYSVAIPVIVR